MPATAKGLRYPEATDNNDVPLHLQQLAEDVDAIPGIRAYTQAQIDALPPEQMWDGRVVWNVTAGVHQKWDGATWSELAPAADARSLIVNDGAAGEDIIAWRRAGDAQNRLLVEEDRIGLGPGNIAPDVFWQRTSIGSQPGFYTTRPLAITHGDGLIADALKNYSGAGITRFYGFRAGTPEGFVTAGPGAVVQDTTNGKLYVKASGTGSTGWVEAGAGATPFTSYKETDWGTTSTGYQDVWSIPVANNERWIVEIFGSYINTANSTISGMTFAFPALNGGGYEINANKIVSASTSGDAAHALAKFGDTSAIDNFFPSGAANPMAFYAVGMFLFGGAGDLKFQAKTGSGTGTMTIKKGSYIRAWKVAAL